MKRIFIALSLLLMMTGCGTYSVTTGKADESAISFTSASKMEITVTVDNKDTFTVESVKTKDWKKDRKIRKTINNTITVTPGTHEVKVASAGTVILEKKIFVSANEHKIIDL